jgi:hypothetical protein
VKAASVTKFIGPRFGDHSVLCLVKTGRNIQGKPIFSVFLEEALAAKELLYVAGEKD